MGFRVEEGAFFPVSAMATPARHHRSESATSRQLDIIATDATAAQSRSGTPLHALQAKPEAERHSCTRQHGEATVLPPPPQQATVDRHHHRQLPLLGHTGGRQIWRAARHRTELPAAALQPPISREVATAAASKALARPGTDRRDAHPKAAAASTASEPSNASLWPSSFSQLPAQWDTYWRLPGIAVATTNFSSYWTSRDFAGLRGTSWDFVGGSTSRDWNFGIWTRA